MEVKIVPGNHLSMVEAPHAQILAHELQDCLDRASVISQPQWHIDAEDQAVRDAQTLPVVSNRDAVLTA
jgi:hypothetical protein